MPNFFSTEGQPRFLRLLPSQEKTLKAGGGKEREEQRERERERKGERKREKVSRRQKGEKVG